ncbi:MAG: hypothetical protein ACRCZ2_04990, partial [Fusobacteriaceae bacterium]
MTLINPGDSMTHVMNNVLNPIITKANKYTEDLVGFGRKYMVDSRKVAFTGNVGDSISMSINGMDPDEKIVRAVVRYYNATDAYDYYYPCTEVSYDPATKIMTANFHAEITDGDLFIEFWKRYDKETPTIELIAGSTEMRKVREDILNPALSRIKDLTQDIVHTGDKCVCDHRVWKTINLGSNSINSTLFSVDEDEHPVRGMFRRYDNALGRADFVPAIFTRFHRASKRLNVFTTSALGGTGHMYLEFWKENSVTPQNTPDVTVGASLSNTRQNSINKPLEQMHAHTQQVVDLSALVKNYIDYRS